MDSTSLPMGEQEEVVAQRRRALLELIQSYNFF